MTLQGCRRVHGLGLRVKGQSLTSMAPQGFRVFIANCLPEVPVFVEQVLR